MWMRIVGAAAVLVSAAVHLYLWVDGFRTMSVIGPAFLLNAVGGAVSTLGAFILSATVGLFGLHERWVGWPVWTAAVSEVVAIVVGSLLLVRDLPASSAGQLQHRPSFRRADLH